MLARKFPAPAETTERNRFFAGAVRQRLALRAGGACAALERLREDEGAFRDATHLAGDDAAPSLARACIGCGGCSQRVRRVSTLAY